MINVMDYGWELLERAEKRKPHDSAPMKLISRGPIFTYVCNECGEWRQETRKLSEPPSCTGGMKHRARGE
jgi:hypothetical protein